MQQTSFEQPGVSLIVREGGAADGVPVLLLHSLFFDGTMFEPLCQALGGGHRFVCPDHRGQGASRPSALAPDIDRLADDMAALLSDRGGAPAHVIGSSMGAYVAMRLAARVAHCVRSCTLLGCTAAAEADPARFSALTRSLRERGPAEIVDTIAYTMFGDTFLADPERAAELARYKAAFARLPCDVADAAEAMFARRGFESEMTSLRIPLLLIAGAEDHAKLPADMQRIADLVPGSRLLVLPRSGHTPVIEATAQVAAALSDWWSASNARAGAVS